MAADSTIDLVATVLRHDPAVTPAQRSELLQMLRGGDGVRRITAEQAARRLNISKRTFWRRLNSGQYEIRRIREGHRSVFFIESDVEALVRG